MSDEFVDVVDSNGTPTGEVLLKSIVHQRGLWHKTAHIWVYTKEGHVLLQLRAKTKNLYPDVWDVSAAGHLNAGEHALHGACRELFEELGLSADPDELEELWTEPAEYPVPGWEQPHREFVTVFLHQTKTKDFLMQKEEVAAIEFIELQTFRNDLADAHKRKRYLPTFGYYERILDAIEERITQ